MPKCVCFWACLCGNVRTHAGMSNVWGYTVSAHVFVCEYVCAFLYFYTLDLLGQRSWTNPPEWGCLNSHTLRFELEFEFEVRIRIRLKVPYILRLGSYYRERNPSLKQFTLLKSALPYKAINIYSKCIFSQNWIETQIWLWNVEKHVMP